ncbi:hypothetical protein Tco_1533179 [Tanacetum coccineum]
MPATPSPRTVCINLQGICCYAQPSFDLPESSNLGGDDTTITTETEPKPPPVVAAQPTGRPWLGQDGLLLKNLKSIFYGGLMDVIARKAL